MTHQILWNLFPYTVLLSPPQQLPNIIHNNLLISVNVPLVSLFGFRSLEMVRTSVASMVKGIDSKSLFSEEINDSVVSVTMLAQSMDNKHNSFNLPIFLGEH